MNVLPTWNQLAASLPARAMQALVSVTPRARRRREAELRAARRLNHAAGLLATSVLADSAVEHYRGSFENPAMFLAMTSSALSLLASLHGGADRRGTSHRLRNAIYLLAGTTGVAGTGFHLYNIGKRDGGFNWLNLFYAAPIGAPMALSLSGLLGFLAERLRDPPQGTHSGTRARLLGYPPGRFLSAVTALGLAGTVGEAGLLHFRGSFQDPFMVLPVTVPPIAASLLGRTAALDDPSPRLRRTARWWLRATAALGLAGVGFHIYGVGRGMGGWRNWSQNVLNGPPVPAPPSFTGLAIAGLAALSLLAGNADE